MQTPGTKRFASLYEEQDGLSVNSISLDLTDNPTPFTIKAGTYYAALVLVDAEGKALERSRVFGPFTVSKIHTTGHQVLTTGNTFIAKIPGMPAPGTNWVIVFGTDRANLNEQLPLGSGIPLVFTDSYIGKTSFGPNYLISADNGYVFGPQGITQPTPGVGPAWYVLYNGPQQGDQSASITVPHFDKAQANFSVGVFVRIQGPPSQPTSYYAAGLSASAPNITIYKVVNGVVSVLASQASIAIPDNSQLSLSVTGTNLVCSLNNVQILTASDAGLVNGTSGFITTGPPISAFASTTTPAATQLIVTQDGAPTTLPEVDTPNAVPAGITVNERCFACSKVGFWEVFSDGYAKWLFELPDDGTQKYLAASSIQILISSGGRVFLFTLADSSHIEILTDGTTALQGVVRSVGVSDSYFIALLRDGRWQISGILDGANWNPDDITGIENFSDAATSMRVDHREITFKSQKYSVTYYNSGNANFPFDVVPGSFAENGIGAADTLSKLDNSLFWLDADERGQGVARRAQGYNPVRISNHAVEEAWRKLPTISDAIAYDYQDSGHTFWVLYFPTANKTWCFDVATGVWHERNFWNGATYEAHRSRCHFFAFGKHLIGDRKTGKIFELSLNYFTDDGATIRRMRRAPYIAKEGTWLFNSTFELAAATGVGPIPPLEDGEGKPRNPQVMVRISDTMGNTWSNERTIDLGMAGEYSKRLILRRLGRFWGTKGRIFEVTDSDPVSIKFTDAYVGIE